MTQQWKVGAATITRIVEDETHHIPPEFFFPAATAAEVAEHTWLIPDYADEQGNINLAVQAFVIELGGRRILVDPCVGNGKRSAIPFWHEMHWPFMERFAEEGFAPETIDLVVHTHLHGDHVGWDTHLVDGAWVPTFTQARHLYTERELAFCRAAENPGIQFVYDDSVAPIFAAGLGEIVDEDADLGGGLRLEPTPGHTPGHVSLWIESEGETALISGDFMHHPVQFARTEWAEIGDGDETLATATRQRMLAGVAGADLLFLGTHFGSRPAGRVVADGDAYRFEPTP